MLNNTSDIINDTATLEGQVIAYANSLNTGIPSTMSAQDTQQRLKALKEFANAASDDSIILHKILEAGQESLWMIFFLCEENPKLSIVKNNEGELIIARSEFPKDQIVHMLVYMKDLDPLAFSEHACKIDRFLIYFYSAPYRGPNKWDIRNTLDILGKREQVEGEARDNARAYIEKHGLHKTIMQYDSALYNELYPTAKVQAQPENQRSTPSRPWFYSGLGWFFCFSTTKIKVAVDAHPQELDEPLLKTKLQLT